MRILRRAGVHSDTAIAVGSFDGVHRGHTAMFERLLESARGRALAAAVLTFEPLPREFFAPAEAPAPVAIDGERVSSTLVRAALAAGDLERAARLLGRRYAICGRVTHGAKRGRGIGFPTANVRLGRRKPALRGIFAVKCYGAATRGL